MKGILIVDHGSVKAEANDMLRCVCNLVQTMAGAEVIVRFAHMELAAPDIPSAFADCVQAGATDITVFPYMLSPGKHSTRDIPRMVAQSAKSFGHVAFNVTPAFGVHEKLAELILDRAGVEPIKAFAGSEADRCWDPDCSETLCGDACRARTARQTALPGGTT